MINLLTCIFTGIIAASSVGVVLFTTHIYDGRKGLDRVMGIDRPKINLWGRIPIKYDEWKMSRIIRKSR